MTREEAIAMLKSKMDGHTDTSYEWAETVRIAIKAIEALEQEPITVEIINQYCKEHNYVLCEKGTEHGKMLTCPNCGLDVHSDFKNCPRCGKRMKDILKCKDCRYLSSEKCTIGRMCLNPSKRFRTKTACWKYPTTPACKLFERR